MEEETAIILQIKTIPNIVCDIAKMWLQELKQSRLSNHLLHTLVTYEGKSNMKNTGIFPKYPGTQMHTHRR